MGNVAFITTELEKQSVHQAPAQKNKEGLSFIDNLKKSQADLVSLFGSNKLAKGSQSSFSAFSSLTTTKDKAYSPLQNHGHKKDETLMAKFNDKKSSILTSKINEHSKESEILSPWKEKSSPLNDDKNKTLASKEKTQMQSGERTEKKEKPSQQDELNEDVVAAANPTAVNQTNQSQTTSAESQAQGQQGQTQAQAQSQGQASGQQAQGQPQMTTEQMMQQMTAEGMTAEDSKVLSQMKDASASAKQEAAVAKFIDNLRNAQQTNQQHQNSNMMQKFIQRQLTVSYQDMMNKVPQPIQQQLGQMQMTGVHEQTNLTINQNQLHQLQLIEQSQSGQEMSNQNQQDSSQTDAKTTQQTESAQNSAQSAQSTKFTIQSQSGGERMQLIQSVMKRIRLMHLNGKSEIKMALNPKELGNMFMKMSSQDGQMNLQLFTDNHAAKAALESSMGQLKQMLQEQGFNLNHVSVEVSPEHPGMGNSHGHNEAQHEAQRKNSKKSLKVSLEEDDIDNEKDELERRILSSHMVNYLV